MSDISFLKTKRNQTDSVSAAQFSKTDFSSLGDGLSRCLIHSSSSNMIGRISAF